MKRNLALGLICCTLAQGAVAWTPIVPLRLGEEVKGQLTASDNAMPYGRVGRCYEVSNVAGRLVEIYYRGGRDLAVERYNNAGCSGAPLASNLPMRAHTNLVSLLVRDDARKAQPFVLQALEVPVALAPGVAVKAAITSTDVTRPNAWTVDCYVFDAPAGATMRATVSNSDGKFSLAIYDDASCKGDTFAADHSYGPGSETIAVSGKPAGRYSIFVSPENIGFGRYELTFNMAAQLWSAGQQTETLSMPQARAAIGAGDCTTGLVTFKARADRFPEPDPLYALGQLAESGTCMAKDMGEARRFYLAAAARGHRSAAYKAGRFLREGVGGPTDLEMARRMLDRAENTRDAKFYLGEMERDGIGGPRNVKDAETHLAQAVEAGSAPAATELAVMRLSQTSEPAERAQYFQLLAEAASAGDATALQRLGALSENEPSARFRYGALLAASTNPSTMMRGRTFLRSAKDAGVAEAGLALAASLAQGSAADRRTAAQLYADAAAAAPKYKYLAEYLRIDLRLNGRGLPPARRLSSFCPDRDDWEKLQRSYARWGLSFDNACQNVEVQAERARARQRLHELTLASLAGDPIAAGLLSAEFERRCEGGTSIAVAACAAWAKALSLQNVRLFSNLHTIQAFNPFHPMSGGMRRPLDVGPAFDPQTGQAPDTELALMFYRAAAEDQRGAASIRAAAYERLYELYANGIGVKRDQTEANRNLSQAAYLGAPEALYKKAMDALGTAKTSDERHNAGLDLKQAADAGVVDAAFRYALMVEKGETSSRKGWGDIATYYEKAALAGHVPSMLGVARAYESGWGGAVDKDKAETWYVRAARVGNAEAAWRMAVIHSERGDYRGSIPWLRKAAKGGWPGAADTLARLQAKGIRERSLGGFLLGALDLLGEVAEGMGEIQAANMEAERLRQQQMTVMGYLPGSDSDSSGGSSASDGGSASADSGSMSSGGSSAGAGSSAIADSGSAGGNSGSSVEGGVGGAGGTLMGEASVHGGNSDGAGSAPGGASNGSNDGASSGGSPSAGGDTFGASVSSSNRSDEASSSQGAIIVSDGAEERAALEAKQAALQAEMDAKAAARKAQEQALQAQQDRETEERNRQTEERHKQALIACYGSLEAAARARVSCE